MHIFFFFSFFLFNAHKTGGIPQCEISAGCNCVKSKCLKKYCECFQGALYCGEKCKCLECENFEGSVSLKDRKTKIRDHRKVSKPFSSSKSDEVGDGTTAATLSHDLEKEVSLPTQPSSSIITLTQPPIQAQVQAQAQVQVQVPTQSLPQMQQCMTTIAPPVAKRKPVSDKHLLNGLPVKSFCRSYVVSLF
jgi:hypothetical protein